MEKPRCIPPENVIVHGGKNWILDTDVEPNPARSFKQQQIFKKNKNEPWSKVVLGEQTGEAGPQMFLIQTTYVVSSVGNVSHLTPKQKFLRDVKHDANIADALYHLFESAPFDGVHPETRRMNAASKDSNAITITPVSRSRRMTKENKLIVNDRYSIESDQPMTKWYRRGGLSVLSSTTTLPTLANLICSTVHNYSPARTSPA